MSSPISYYSSIQFSTFPPCYSHLFAKNLIFTPKRRINTPNKNENAHKGRKTVPMLGTLREKFGNEMDAYSQNPDTKGIGAFINLRKDSSVSGDDIGQWIRNQFAAVGVPVEYRVNQSRGSATDITLYAGGFDFTVNVAELEKKLPTIYAHHQDVWTPAKTASVNDAALTQ